MRQRGAIIAVTALAAASLLVASPAAADPLDDGVLLGTFPDRTVPEVVVGDDVFFTVDRSDDVGLWVTDGRTADLVETFDEVEEVAAFDGAAYLSAADGDQVGLWRATPDGASFVRGFAAGGPPPLVDLLTASGDHLYFAVGGHDLWATDGEDVTHLSEWDGFHSLSAASGGGVLLVGAPAEGGEAGMWYDHAGGGADLPYFLDGTQWIEDSAVLGDLTVLSADHPSYFGVVMFDSFLRNTTPVAEAADVELASNGSSVLIDALLGNGDRELLRFDGSSFTQLQLGLPPFSLIDESTPFGDEYAFWGEHEEGDGLWVTDEDSLAFVAPTADILDIKAFGDGVALIEVDGDGERLSYWDGVSDEVQPIRTWKHIERMRATPDRLIVVGVSDENGYEVWSFGAETVHTIALTPSESTITAGELLAFTVEGFDREGASVGDVTEDVTLEIEPTTGFTVNEGEVTFTRAGDYTVTATYGDGITATATVTVEPADLASIVVEPSDASAIVGDVVEYTAAGYDEYGNALGDLTDSATFTTDVDGATVDESAIRFDALGTGTVTATIGATSGATGVTVEAGDVTSLELDLSATTVDVGDSITVTVLGLNANSVVVDDLTDEARIESDKPDIVDGNTVTFTSASPHVITAMVGELSASAVVEVRPAGLATSGVEPWVALASALALLAAGGVAVAGRIRRTA